MFSCSGQHSSFTSCSSAQPVPVSSPAGGWTTARVQRGVCSYLPSHTGFSNPYKRCWGCFVGFYFSSLFFFPGKREIKVVPSPCDLTSSPQCIFFSALFNLECNVQELGGSPERILPPFFPPGPCRASLPPGPPCPARAAPPALPQAHFPVTGTCFHSLLSNYNDEGLFITPQCSVAAQG